MVHLCELLGKLPRLPFGTSWNGYWFLDLPLCAAVECTNSQGRGDNVVDPCSIPLSYLVSDLLQWLPSHQMFCPLRSLLSTFLTPLYCVEYGML